MNWTCPASYKTSTGCIKYGVICCAVHTFIVVGYYLFNHIMDVPEPEIGWYLLFVTLDFPISLLFGLDIPHFVPSDATVLAIWVGFWGGVQWGLLGSFFGCLYTGHKRKRNGR